MTVAGAVLAALVVLLVVLVLGLFLTALTLIVEALVHRRPKALLGPLAVAVGSGAALFGAWLIVGYALIAI